MINFETELQAAFKSGYQPYIYLPHNTVFYEEEEKNGYKWGKINSPKIRKKVSYRS
jgi:hypothetical protein